MRGNQKGEVLDHMPEDKPEENVEPMERCVGWLVGMSAIALKISLWASLFIIIATGAFASILLVTELIPDHAHKLMPFVRLQKNFYAAVIYSLVLLISFSLLKLIPKMIRYRNRCKEVKNNS